MNIYSIMPIISLLLRNNKKRKEINKGKITKLSLMNHQQMPHQYKYGISKFT